METLTLTVFSLQPSPAYQGCRRDSECIVRVHVSTVLHQIGGSADAGREFVDMGSGWPRGWVSAVAESYREAPQWTD
jgi:hypothetical protein